MALFLILVAVVIFTCVLLNNASLKLGMPVLLAFILFGILFGNNGLLPIKMDDYDFVEQLCSTALIFIMFYGGFGTRWSSARPVAVESVLMATVGVILTAGITGVLCHFILGWKWLESLLMGSMVSSTDAASVFSILRSRKLGLRNGTAPLLEVESGSNDPCSYMMTIVILSLMQGGVGAGRVVWMLFAQLGFGALFGLLIAQAASYMMKHFKFSAGYDSLFLIAISLFSYAIPSLCGGNGYLSAYLVGIILGNREFDGKKEMVHFFDGFTGLMQILIFFMLGLLARPAQLHQSLLPAAALFLILLLVARPLTTMLVLKPFGRYGFRQLALISFCGLRGAASIVFAIIATVDNDALYNDLFNVVFCIVLLSISLQGTLIPYVAKKLDMIDPDADVMKTFSDFSEEVDLQFTEITLHPGSSWCGKQVRNLGIPSDVLMCNVIRKGGEKIVPNGDTMLMEGDQVIICSKSFQGSDDIRIIQVPVGNDLDGKLISDFHSTESQIILILRGNESIIPHGDTALCEGDILYINKSIR